jgi:hypothetical protein
VARAQQSWTQSAGVALILSCAICADGLQGSCPIRRMEARSRCLDKIKHTGFAAHRQLPTRLPQWPRSGEIEAKSGGSGSRSKKFRRDFQAPAKPTKLARQALSRLNQLFECASKLQRASSGIPARHNREIL